MANEYMNLVAVLCGTEPNMTAICESGCVCVQREWRGLTNEWEYSGFWMAQNGFFLYEKEIWLSIAQMDFIYYLARRFFIL